MDDLSKIAYLSVTVMKYGQLREFNEVMKTGGLSPLYHKYHEDSNEQLERIRQDQILPN